jgi:hypothetical protein
MPPRQLLFNIKLTLHARSMKSIFLFFTVLFAARSTFAQIFVGDTGLLVTGGTIISSEGLSLSPTSDWTITNNSLTRSSTPVLGNPTSSIERVYHFGSLVTFSGSAVITYLEAELNSNIETSLQIFYKESGSAFTNFSGSVVDVSAKTVSGNLNVPSLLAITAASENAALPVTLVAFRVNAEDNNAILQWSTQSETMADYFGIEHSIDLKLWTDVGRVEAAGESIRQENYFYMDTDLTDATHYYRLRMVDKDGRFAVSTIKSVTVHSGQERHIYPNPVVNVLQLRHPANEKVTGAQIYDVLGRLALDTNDFPDHGLRVNNLNPGIYTLKIEIKKNQVIKLLFVKK